MTGKCLYLTPDRSNRRFWLILIFLISLYCIEYLKEEWDVLVSLSKNVFFYKQDVSFHFKILLTKFSQQFYLSIVKKIKLWSFLTFWTFLVWSSLVAQNNFLSSSFCQTRSWRSWVWPGSLSSAPHSTYSHSR